ncbi:MAG: general stress protein CsbD [Chitinophagaceae bacterium]|nr:general stress protein CsbD [Chitinophagaceae bacterium]
MKLKIEAPWYEVKEKLKENDHTLTDEDLAYEKGREDELLERLSRKLKRSKQQVRMLIESISGNSGKAA